MEAARMMASDLLRSKHAIEDELVAFVLDCNRCGRRVHWVFGEGCDLGHWAHAEPTLHNHAHPLRAPTAVVVFEPLTRATQSMRR
jgi:hypothetical protein